MTKHRLIFLCIICFLNKVIFAQEVNKNGNNQPALTDYIDIYQRYIGPIRESSCQMHPSCSNFGMRVYQSYNPIKATFLTADRLLRCSHDLGNYNRLLTTHGIRMIDFPENNSIEERMLLRKNINIVLYSAIDTSSAGKFVNYLISQKYYREALLELNRLIFYNSNMHDTQFLNYLICKRALNEFEDAVYSYENSFPNHVKNNYAIINELGNINYELGNYTKAIDYFDYCLSSSDPILHEKSFLMKGLIFANQKKWKESKNMFLSLSDIQIYSYSKKSCLEILQDRERIRYKKPYLAGIYSIIPGLGYVYSGHKQTALSSIIFNGLLAYASYTSFKSENYGIAVLTGLFSFSFYIGNISGSVKSAQRYNSKKDFDTIARLKSNIYY